MCFGSQYFRQVPPQAAWRCGERGPNPARRVRERRGRICGGCGKHLRGIGLRQIIGATVITARVTAGGEDAKRGSRVYPSLMVLRCSRHQTTKKVETRVL